MDLKQLWSSWFGKDNSKADDYYSANERKQIEELKTKIVQLTEENNNTRKSLTQSTDYNVELLDEIDGLKEQLKIHNKHQSLETFKQYLHAIVVPTKKTYNFRGKGNEACHLSLAPYTPLKMQTFIEDVMKFNYKSYKKADSMIYEYVVAFHKKFPNNIYYGSDMQNFGVADYWESPDEAIARFSSKKSSDCDAHGSALYGTIRYMLEQRFPTELWRLRVFVVRTISGSGHYILSWVKEGPNDWIPLETTWYPDSIRRAWTENLGLRDQIMYKVWWSFDDKYEYVKL